MDEIWKYELNCDALGHNTELVIPTDAEILTAQLQHERIMLWVRCNPSNAKETRRFTVIATGQPFDGHNLKYLATVQLSFGFVGHIFEANTEEKHDDD